MRYEQEFSAWPIPDERALAFVCEWPAYGIPETRTEIDSQPLRDAAKRAVPIWPGVTGPTYRGRSSIAGWLQSAEARPDEDAED